MRNLFGPLFIAASIFSSTPSLAVYFSGNGHFALRGESRTAPGFQSGTGTYQAIDRSFAMLAEARLNENASIFLDTRLNTTGDTLGNTATTSTGCSVGDTCSEPFTGDSSYEPFFIGVQQAYAKVGTDYCLISAGRRARDWGLGIYLDSGSDAFETSQSVFDGVTCDVNIQKSQNLGFSIGYDKISEGNPLFLGDDLDQIFITVEFDDRSTSSTYSKHIALYLASISSGNGDSIGSVDYKVFDLYAAFYLGNISLMSEAVFRTGKSEEAKWSEFGGSGTANHDIDAISFGLKAEWAFSSSGTTIGVKPYQSGSASKHIASFEYYRAPGDSDGYYKGADPTVGIDNVSSSAAEAYRFNKNFKPAILLFNGRQDSNDMTISGVYENDAVVNASIFSIGYRYESIESGIFSAKIVSASMNESIPSEVEQFFDSSAAPSDYHALAGAYPVGYFGTDIGTEIDLSYTMKFSNSFTLELAGAYAMPGSALQISDESPEENMAVQTTFNMNF